MLIFQKLCYVIMMVDSCPAQVCPFESLEFHVP